MLFRMTGLGKGLLDEKTAKAVAYEDDGTLG